MMSASSFTALLEQRDLLVIDGGLATELEAQGHDLAHPLWSGKVIQDEPSAIKAVHLAYYEARADIAITSSYQTSVRGLEEHLRLDASSAIDLIRTSVLLAHQARAEYELHGKDQRRLLVAGSVGPYGAFLADGSEYNGDYQLSELDLQNFHKARIAALVEAGVDLLALETMPNLQEISGLLTLLREDFSDVIAWVSCTLRDSHHIADGTSIKTVLETITSARPQIVAFGVNCLPPDLVAGFLTEARKYTDIPLLCYPNSGEQYDAVSKTWQSSECVAGADYLGLVKQWHSLGATMIGGCCRTGPLHIQAISKAFRSSLDAVD